MKGLYLKTAVALAGLIASVTLAPVCAKADVTITTLPDGSTIATVTGHIDGIKVMDNDSKEASVSGSLKGYKQMPTYVAPGPEGICTRGETMRRLYEAMGFPKAASLPAALTDVNEDDPWGGAVAWALETGITKGTSDTTFSPEKPCTRGQVITFLHRALGKPHAASSIRFTDVAPDAFYADAVAWAVANGVTKGTGDTTFSPDSICTVAQIEAFITRALGK